MSSTDIDVTIGIELTEPPTWLIGYLKELSGQWLGTEAVEIPRDWAKRLPRVEDVERTSGSLQPTTTGRYRFELVGQTDERAGGRIAALLDVLIESAQGEQVVATVAASSSWDVTVHAIRSGERFRSNPGRWTNAITGEPSPVVGEPSPSRERASLVRHGASRAVLDLADKDATGEEPHLAAYLLARTVARALEGRGALEALPDVLAALGLGEDEWGQSTAPGWRVVETADGTETGRRLGGLAALGEAMAGSRLTGADLQIEVGTVLVARRPHRESLRLFGGGCRVIAVDQGEQIVVTEFHRTGTGMGFGVARDADGGEVPFRGEFIGSIFDIVEE